MFDFASFKDQYEVFMQKIFDYCEMLHEIGETKCEIKESEDVEGIYFNPIGWVVFHYTYSEGCRGHYEDYNSSVVVPAAYFSAPDAVAFLKQEQARYINEKIEAENKLRAKMEAEEKKDIAAREARERAKYLELKAKFEEVDANV